MADVDAQNTPNPWDDEPTTFSAYMSGKDAEDGSVYADAVADVARQKPLLVRSTP